MATVTGLTADRMLTIEAESIVGAHLNVDNLILVRHDGSTIDVGSIRGPQGPPYLSGVDTINTQTIGGVKTFTRGVIITPSATGESPLAINAPSGLSTHLVNILLNSLAQFRIDNIGSVLALGNTNKFGRGAFGGTGVAVQLSEDATNTFISAIGTPTDVTLALRPKGSGGISFQDAGGVERAKIDPVTGNISQNGHVVSGGTLGYAEIVTGSAAFGATLTAISGLSTTVSVPAGHRVKVTVSIQFNNQSGSPSLVRTQIQQDGVQIGGKFIGITANEWLTYSEFVTLSPSAGPHTYRFAALIDTGTCTVGAGAGQPCNILVEDIGV